MKEIRIHGRGGQGAVTAAALLAMAAFRDGKEVQAFPFFGVERTGAPVVSFARVDDRPIRLRAQIYEPDYLIVLDPTLPKEIIEKGTGEKTVAVINSKKSVKELGFKFKKAIAVDASGAALEAFGRAIVNTGMLGVFAAFTGEMSLESLKEAIGERFEEKGEKVVKKNEELIERLYKKTEKKMEGA